MESLLDVQRKIIKGILVLNGCIGIIVALFISPPLPFLVGLSFGTIISILNFRLLYLALNKAVQMQEHKAKVYAATRYVLRYIIVGIVLYISIRADHINVLGTIIGMLTLKIVILKNQLFNDKIYFKNIIRRKEAE